MTIVKMVDGKFFSSPTLIPQAPVALPTVGPRRETEERPVGQEGPGPKKN